MLSRISRIASRRTLALCALFMLCGVVSQAQTAPLSFRPRDARYSAPLEKIVMITTNPGQVHLYDPLTGNDAVIALSKPALSLDVSPDGLHAVVGQDQLVSYVDLSARTVQATYPVAFTADVVVLGDTELDAFSSSIPSTGFILDLASLTQGKYDIPIQVSGAVFDASSRRIYLTLPYAILLRSLNVSAGVSSALPRQFLSGDAPSGSGKVWLSADHSRVYTACPAVFSLTSSSLPSLPFTYISNLSGNPRVQSVAESPASSTLAVIPDPTSGSACQATPQADDHVLLYDSHYNQQKAQLALAPFAVSGKSYPAHGRFDFYNTAGTKLFVVAQADSAAGLSNDYVVQTFDLANPAVCAPSLSLSTLSVPGSGGLGSVDITAPSDCQYQSSSDSSWVQIISGGSGSGNQTLQFIVRPNPTGSTRTANLTVGTQKVTISQASAPGFSAHMPLGFQVLFADYSKSLDRAILVPSAPNELHIYDSSTGADQIVPLPLPPSSVGVSPDGTHAAVGYDGWISSVNLTTGVVEKTLPAGGAVTKVAMSNAGIAYFVRQINLNNTNVLSLDFSSGAISTISFTPSNVLRLDPSGTTLYLDNTLLRLGASTSQYGFPSVCGNLWLSDDASEAVTACGQFYSLPTSSSDTPKYLGSVEGSSQTFGTRLTSAADSAVLRTTATIPYRGPSDPASFPDDTQVRLYGGAYHDVTGQSTLPKVNIGPQSYATHGKFVFWNAASDRLIVFTQPDSAAPAANSYVDVYAPSLNAASCAVTPASTTATAGAQGSFGNISVNAADGCAWTATSGAPWLSLTGGVFGLGQGVVDYVASVNPTTSPRTATITLNSTAITITQPGAAGTVSLAPTSVNVPASGGSGSVFVTASSPSFSWAIATGPSWITLDTGLTTTGNAQLHYTVAPSSLTTARVGTFFIQGQPFTITQAGATATVTPGKTQFSEFPDSTTVTVTTDSPALSWNASSDAPWVSFNSLSANITGSGQFTLNVTANPSNSPRSANITVAGQSFKITQSGAQFDLASNGSVFGPAGGSGEITLTSILVTVQATASVNWITVSSAPQSGGTVPYSVAAYSGSQPRSGTITVSGKVFTVVQAGSDPLGYNFVPMTPCRAIDTRVTDGPGFQAFGGRTFQPSFRCKIPPTAVAFSLNITAIPIAGKLDFLTIYPAYQALPDVSTLNSYDGRVVANAAIVPAGPGLSIAGYATDPTNVVIDVTGYFDVINPQGLSFYPLSPCRALDTRNATGPLGGPKLVNGSRDFPIASSACQTPASAQAYSMNVTAVPTGNLNFLTVWPTGQTQPLTSTLNSYDGSVVANAAISPAGTNGSVSAFASGSTDVLMDLNGIFAPSGSVAGTTGLKFYPVKPCRAADTRNPNGPLGAPAIAANQIRAFPIAGTCGVPANAQAFALNVTVVPKTSSLHFLTLWPAGQPRPEASTLNSYQGKVLANAAIVPAGTNGSVNAFATDDTELILDVNGYFAP